MTTHTKPKAKPNGWEEDFDKEFAMKPEFDGEFMKQATYCKDVKDFIRQAILSAEERKTREFLEAIEDLGIEHELYGFCELMDKKYKPCCGCILDRLYKNTSLSLPDQEQSNQLPKDK